MTHHTEADLLPCPFCGAHPETDFIPEHHSYAIECHSIGCAARVIKETAEDAVKAWNRRAPAAPVPQGWIDPNDKAQKQYLPHIGERVLLKHDGCVYLGKHTGGSFKAEYPLGKTFGTWACKWMYPSVLDAAAPQPPEAEPVELPEPAGVVHSRLGELAGFKALPFVRKGEKLYTEQQVRQLLAAHGIQEQST